MHRSLTLAVRKECRMFKERYRTATVRVREKIENTKISKFRLSTSLTRRSTTRSSGPPNHLASPPRERSRRWVDFFTGSEGVGAFTRTFQTPTDHPQRSAFPPLGRWGVPARNARTG